MEPLVVDQELPEPANVAEEGDEEDADDATSPS